MKRNWAELIGGDFPLFRAALEEAGVDKAKAQLIIEEVVAYKRANLEWAEYTVNALQEARAEVASLTARLDGGVMEPPTTLDVSPPTTLDVSPPTTLDVSPPTTLDVSPSTTITVNGRIDPDPWDDETYLRVDEELFEMVRFVKAWVDPETGKYCETWEIKPREGGNGG